MSKKLLMTILALSVAVGLVGAGTYAWWSDSVASTGNTFSTGSLALLVNDSHDPGARFHFDHIAPSLPSGYQTFTFTAKNNGTIPGNLSAVGAFSGPLDHALVVSSVKIDGVEMLPAGEYYLDSIPGGGLSIPAAPLAAGAERTVTVTIGLPSGETGHMNETETGSLTFTLAQ
jgi:predicted ribosomally synthesized peptide with SipW-like signal peptide